MLLSNRHITTPYCLGKNMLPNDVDYVSHYEEDTHEGNVVLFRCKDKKTEKTRKFIYYADRHDLNEVK